MLTKLLTLLARGEFAQLHYHLWLRLRRLDISSVNCVSKADGASYSNSGGPRLEKVLRALAIDRERSVLLEHGVGKAIACITFSRYFARIIGVDLSPELIAIARRNLRKVGVTNVELYTEDARTFTTSLDDVTHVYIFNSFTNEVLLRVIGNLRDSVKRKPRTLTVIFLAPYKHQLFLDAGFTHVRDFDFGPDKDVQDRFSIYAYC